MKLIRFLRYFCGQTHVPYLLVFAGLLCNTCLSFFEKRDFFYTLCVCLFVFLWFLSPVCLSVCLSINGGYLSLSLLSALSLSLFRSFLLFKRREERQERETSEKREKSVTRLKRGRLSRRASRKGDCRGSVTTLCVDSGPHDFVYRLVKKLCVLIASQKLLWCYNNDPDITTFVCNLSERYFTICQTDLLTYCVHRDWEKFKYKTLCVFLLSLKH